MNGYAKYVTLNTENVPQHYYLLDVLVKPVNLY